ncbi:hypothetical protein KQI61_15275 [Anaerocolumna aminovalerica]|uniref:hypothetical protein n=1 Tax=Anaerocolumna aminovalerica TaxID=1527 RepID=UPI001C0EBDAC|nr:hypothetical protein [Anaerocolumna aminovalerica]MBU5333560.1 hypothetical protein [Anaerocolumna aminovalerica]
MKKFIIKYRAWLISIFGLVFGLIESLLVYRPDGVVFNVRPLTVAEWILDIISIAIFYFGIILAMYDANKDAKLKIKEGIMEAANECNCEIEINQ